MSVAFARHALLPAGWARDVRFVCGPSGEIASVEPGASAAGATHLAHVVLPGMPNAHSHAFQRAIAGVAETSASERDSFWTWRDAMYAAIATLDPDAFEATTRAAFDAMARAGYAHVCEFHYVHNAPDGRRYDDPNELAHRVVAAARAAGLGLTLLPVLYRFSDFGEVPPQPQQRRFVRTLDAYADAWRALRAAYASDPRVVVGIAPHSLRAVSPADLRALEELAASDRTRPVPMHVHASEQTREVEACRERYGTTPIALLAEHVTLDDRWCLIHATHATPDERATIARAGAVVALCPTTEANLGDGIFPAAEFVRAGGLMAIGSDSNASIDVAEELRWLEYVQRLALRRRNVLRDDAVHGVARFVYERCASGGARAAGAPIGTLAAGSRATLVALEPHDGEADRVPGGASADDPDIALSRAIFAPAAGDGGSRFEQLDRR